MQTTSVNTLTRRIAQNVRYHRKRRGWTQEVLAELMHVHRNHIGKLERGDVRLYVEFLARLAGMLEVTVDTLIDSGRGAG